MAKDKKWQLRNMDLGVNEGEMTRPRVGERGKAPLANHLGNLFTEETKNQNINVLDDHRTSVV